MRCQQARLSIGAEPSASSPSLEAHLRGCVDCREFQREMTALDADIRRALELTPVAMPGFSAPEIARKSAVRKSRRWFTPSLPVPRRALAASLIAAVVAVGLVWGLRPTDSLADDVIEHLAGEPASWSYTDSLTPAAVSQSLRTAAVSFDTTGNDVVYAMSCWFHGRYIPHLVIVTPHGSFTVLVLADEQVSARQRFKDDDYEGVLLPASGGSLAVIARGHVEIDAVDEIARKVFAALHWSARA